MDKLATHQPYLVAEQIKENNKLPILVLGIENNGCMPAREVFQILHKHEELEFIYVEENQLHIKTTMSEVILNKGEAIFIPKNTLHVLNTYGTCKCTAVLFPESLLMPAALTSVIGDTLQFTENPLIDLVHLTPSQNTTMINTLLEISTLNKSTSPDSIKYYRLLASIYDLWASLLDTTDINSKMVHPLAKAKSDRLVQYIEYVQFNFHLPISIEDIANSGFTSVSECNRTFKELLKLTAYEYLIQYRINKSLELLKTNLYSIADISYKVGYNSPSQFAKYFKQHINMTPTQYRKSNIA